MNKPTLATLLSIFVCPGAGHFLLKKYIAGAILAGSASVALYIVIAKTVETALFITNEIQRGEMPLDLPSITKLITQQTAGPDAQLLNIATAVLFIAWLIGIVDVYRVGRNFDNSDTQND